MHVTDMSLMPLHTCLDLPHDCDAENYFLSGGIAGSEHDIVVECCRLAAWSSVTVIVLFGLIYSII